MAKPHNGKAPTIVDVAKAAGVSVSTASRVVREHPDVSEDTRQRVLGIIQTMRYRPSAIARALVAGQARLLALLVSDITNPFYPQLAKAVEQESGKHGYMVVICNTADRTAESRRYVEALLRQGLDGLIHASVADDEEMVLSLLEDRNRIVFTNRRPADPHVSYVVSNNRAGAKALTDHFLAQGHRRIGFINGPSYASNIAERFAGYRDAMEAVDGTEQLVADGDFSPRSGVRAVNAWLDSGKPPTAVIAVNDSVALSILEALNARGLRAPENMAVAGFDGVALAASPLVNVTSVDQHIDRMGRAAVRMLLKQIEDPDVAMPQRQVLPTKLLIRSSTGAILSGHPFT